MKINKLLLLASLFIVVGCNNPSLSSSQGETKSNFDIFKEAITFETNDAYTGYRLYTYIKSNGKNIYSKSKILSIDKTNSTAELSETIIQINSDVDDTTDQSTTSTHLYFTRGSIIKQLEDGRYVEIDVEVNFSTGLPKFNPTEDCFTELNLDLNGNILEMSGTIDPSKANQLFVTEGLENISNATMEADIYDNILEEVNWAYSVDELEVSQRLVISYDNFEIYPPAVD